MGSTVKTLSQLDELESLNDRPESIWMEVSKPESGDSYSSKKCSYYTLEKSIISKTESDVAKAFNLSTDGGYKADVKGIDFTVTQLTGSSITIDGQKTFTTAPLTPDIDIDEDTSTQMVANIGVVKQVISKYGGSYSSVSKVGKCPVVNNDNDGINGSVYDSSSEYLYYMHIDEGGYDTSKYKDDTNNGEEVGWLKINQSGQLVIYGWLADNGTLAAQESWVGLFAKIYDEESGQYKVVPLQIQPWIQGNKHAIVQYVSFNVGVGKGLEIKIMTGFPVNGNSGMQSTGNSLMFKSGNVPKLPNTFIGYVIHT